MFRQHSRSVAVICCNALLHHNYYLGVFHHPRVVYSTCATKLDSGAVAGVQTFGLFDMCKGEIQVHGGGRRHGCKEGATLWQVIAAVASVTNSDGFGCVATSAFTEVLYITVPVAYSHEHGRAS